MMTLMQIELVLHYYWSPLEHPYVVNEWGGVRQAIDGLLADGLLEIIEGKCGATYEATEKAAVYIEAIRGVALPVQQWVIPK